MREQAVRHPLRLPLADAGDDRDAHVDRSRGRVAAGVGQRVEDDVDQAVTRAIDRIVLRPGNEDDALGRDAEAFQPPPVQRLLRSPCRRKGQHALRDRVENPLPQAKAARRELQ